jgi:hypothetical protein
VKNVTLAAVAVAGMIAAVACAKGPEAQAAGSFMSKLSVATDGPSGRVEVSSGGDIKVLISVLTNGKGDVCANGDPGKQVCMSGLAIKSLIRY